MIKQELNKIKFTLIRRGFTDVKFAVICHPYHDWTINFMFRDRSGKIARQSWRLDNAYSNSTLRWIKDWVDTMAPESETEKVERILENYGDN